MKFTVNTRALRHVTDLGIIKANISRFYPRSNVIQITADRDTLRLNIETSGIKTKMVLGGSGDDDTTVSVLVDCSVFKSLINSIDAEVISLEFIDGGVYVHAGNSKFAIPKLLDVNDVQLDTPTEGYTAVSTVTINPANWQFIKDHQMYAIATSDNHPIYMNVWVGKDKEVIVGDFDSSLFTYSKQGDFDSTCLFPASIINLLASIPSGSTVSKIDKNYILNISTDSYSMVTEFTPKYEEDESVGNYNSEIILKMLQHPDSYITVDVAPIAKFLNQSAILRQSDLDKVIDFTISNGVLQLVNRASSCTIPVDTDASYAVKFSADFLKSVLANLDAETIHIAPMMRGDRPIGGIFWTDTLTTLLAGMG